MSDVLIKNLCIIGVGLIGGSLARALRQAGVVEKITGCGRDESHLQTARALGVIDEYELDYAQAVSKADMIVLAVPLGVVQAVLKVIADHIPENAVLTDVGSAKASVVNAVEQTFGCLPESFVPGHPIAGTEKSGVEASFAELFNERRIILTPTEQTSKAALQRVEAMWQACGAEVVSMSVEHHDEVLAATSHLPHMLAFALVDSLARQDDSQEIFEYAAGGFRDFTRIASSNPQMWHDICLANHDALVKSLETFSEELVMLAKAVREGDSAFIKSTFERAKQARDAFCKN